MVSLYDFGEKVLNKKDIWIAVNKKINYTVNSKDTFVIINILLDEIKKDLYENNKIFISNFGTFYLKNLPERKMWSFVTNKYVTQRARKKLAIVLDPFLSKVIKQHINYVKIMGSNK
jgi:nucleoid DNA-binding protein